MSLRSWSFLVFLGEFFKWVSFNCKSTFKIFSWYITNYKPLQEAVRFGHLKVVKYLVDSGANIHAEMLQKAEKNGYFEVVKCLTSKQKI